MIEILPDAIFLSDSHENIDKRAFLRLLKAFKSQKEPLPRQIFLLGDMFDFLTFTTYSKQFFSEYITLLNELGKDCEIFYFEFSIFFVPLHSANKRCLAVLLPCVLPPCY